jgi:hypothetical protein
MKNKFYFFGSHGRMFCAIALLAAIAFGMAACDSGFGGGGGGGGGGTDPQLNGTWGVPGQQTLIFNNGIFEIQYTYLGQAVKGTYYTTGGSLTLTPTHWMNSWDEWCTRADLKAQGYTENELNSMF